MRPLVVVWLGLVACGEQAIEMTLRLPEDDAHWDTSCVQTIEVYTAGANYPQQSDDFLGQTLDLSDTPAPTYAALKQAVRGKFEVAIPDSGLSAVEMYGWNGQSGFVSPSTVPDLIFYARVPYTGQDTVSIDLVANLDCRLSPVAVRPIDLISLVTTRSCTAAAVPDADGYATLGTLSPGLYKPYLFWWGGSRGAPLTDGVARFDAPTDVGPQTCLEVTGYSATAFSSSCVTSNRACAQPGEIEAVLIDDTYARNSLDAQIQTTLRGGVVGAVLDAAHNPIAGATVTIPPDRGRVVFVNVDVPGKRLVPVAGEATTASGMFILYSNDLVDAQVTATVGGAPKTKTVRVGAQRTADSFKMPAGVIVTL